MAERDGGGARKADGVGQAGQKARLRRAILAGFAVPVAIFIVASVLAYDAVRTVTEAEEDLARTQDIQKLSGRLALRFQQAASELRGYLITADPAFAERHEAATEDFGRALVEVEPLVQNDEARALVVQLERDHETYQEFVQQVLAQMRAGNQSGARELLETGRGVTAIAAADATLQRFMELEDDLYDARAATLQGALRLLTATVLLGALAAMAAAVGAGAFIRRRVTRTVDDVNHAISSIATSNVELAATVEQHERAASQQAVSVNETTATMEELDGSARQAAQQAEAAARASREVLDFTQAGTRTVQETLRAMGTTKEKVTAFSEQILRLSEQVGQIADVTRAVGDIAGQVNMLALNAAVEAARAGEHGRGFAVVATEIRKLADQSRREAERIRAIVEDIQKATHATVLATEEGARMADESMGHTSRTAETFGQMARSINDATERVQQISLNVRQQSEGIKQVVEAMNAITVGARQTAAGIAQTKALIQSQEETVQRLKAAT